jgi:glycosyltransferase involved in cell wall biosynthesis
MSARQHSDQSVSQIDGRPPIVSFIVPCYKLAHFLAECVNSILGQTYQDLEILIMDDCSPDDTMQVAASFRDRRVRYVRNHENVGHLRNYNIGIGLSRGKYVWLISADDRLRRSHVVERYVRVMETHPNVGMVCCPGVVLQNGHETGMYGCGDFGRRDKILKGHAFIAASLRADHGLLAPSVMVRKECYTTISTFPLDMPHQGDWYLWFRWALDYDVAYLAEPMVNYRAHDLNIMKDLISRVPDTVFRDEVNVLWRTKKHCEEQGEWRLAARCEESVTVKYARAAASVLYADVSSHRSMSTEQCEHELRANASDEPEYKRLCAKFRGYLANQHWRHGEFARAREDYVRALREKWVRPNIWLKILLLRMGGGQMGILFRRLQQRTMS